MTAVTFKSAHTVLTVYGDITDADSMYHPYAGKRYRPARIVVMYSRRLDGEWEVHSVNMSGAFVKKDDTSSSQPARVGYHIEEDELPRWARDFIAAHHPARVELRFANEEVSP